MVWLCGCGVGCLCGYMVMFLCASGLVWLCCCVVACFCVSVIAWWQTGVYCVAVWLCGRALVRGVVVCLCCAACGSLASSARLWCLVIVWFCDRVSFVVSLSDCIVMWLCVSAVVLLCGSV